MENNVPEVPNSPTELLAMQNQRSGDKEDPWAFATFLAEAVIPNEDPSPYQTVKAMEMMLTRLVNYHFDTLQEDDLTPWQRKVWKEDYKMLAKALKCVRLVNPD